MAIGLVWIIGIYGLCALLVHGAHRLQHRKMIYVALVTLNNETQIEWYLRSFLWISALRGRMIYVMVFDAGSTDETLAIIAKLASNRDDIKVEASAEGLLSYMGLHSEDSVIVLDIMNRSAKESWLIPNW
jgi:glycosyltransferase involved in cell wall biosynthesis